MNGITIIVVYLCSRGLQSISCQIPAANAKPHKNKGNRLFGALKVQHAHEKSTIVQPRARVGPND